MYMGTIAVEQAKPHALRLSERIFSFPALLTAVLVAKVYWTCRDRIADPDMWWHLRNAQYLVANWRFPNVDMYSFTAAGSPWLNTQWLSELFYYAAFRAFGLQGIFLLFASVLAVMVVAVFYLCLDATDDPLASAIATIFGGLLAMVGFAPRTQLFAWLCFVAIYAILRRFRSGRDAPLWLIPVLFCVWINCHGSWLMGLAVYGIFVSAGLIRHDIGRLPAAPWSNRELKKLILTGLASIQTSELIYRCSTCKPLWLSISALSVRNGPPPATYYHHSSRVDAGGLPRSTRHIGPGGACSRICNSVSCP